MEEQNQKEGQDQKAPSMMDSVLMAFNMGVKKMQDEGSIKSTLEAGNDLYQEIYNNLQKAYGTAIDENFLKANAEYFLNVALMGYVFPSICSYDDDFKNRLFGLIEKKLQQSQQRRQAGGQGGQQGGNIIVP